MTDDSDWPLPSQSPRVRARLYLAEGIALGAGVLFVLRLFGTFLPILDPDPFAFDLAPVDVVGLLVFSFLAVRTLVFVRAARRSSPDGPTYPPEYRDWSETRRWRWVGAIALLASGALLELSVVLWGRLLSPDGGLLVSATILVGLSLHLYVFQRVGVKIV